MNLFNSIFKRKWLVILLVIVASFLIVYGTFRGVDALTTKMAGFVGSVLGGVIGGLFTYLGVNQTIKYENKVSRKKELQSSFSLFIDMERLLSQSIKSLDDLHTKVFSSNLDDNESFNKLWKGFEEYREQVRGLEYKLLHNCLLIDVDIYRHVTGKMNTINDRFVAPFGILQFTTEGDTNEKKKEQLSKFMFKTRDELYGLHKYLRDSRAENTTKYEKIK